MKPVPGAQKVGDHLLRKQKCPVSQCQRPEAKVKVDRATLSPEAIWKDSSLPLLVSDGHRHSLTSDCITLTCLFLHDCVKQIVYVQIYLFL